MRKEPRYAGFWMRILARVLDLGLLSLLMVYPLMMFCRWLLFDGVNLIRNEYELILGWIIPATIVLGFWYWKGATPGKMLIRTRIVDADTLGTPSVGKWFLRYFVYFMLYVPLTISFFWGMPKISLDEFLSMSPEEMLVFQKTCSPFLWILFLSGLPLLLGMAWCGWDKRKQAWHDKAANTVVLLIEKTRKK